MQGLARNSGWNAARTEPFDFSLRYSNCPVCRYSGATKDLFSRAALRLQPWQVLGPASARACAHQQPRRAPAPKDGDLVLFEKILISCNFKFFVLAWAVAAIRLTLPAAGAAGLVFVVTH